jgi:hypothetical protein
MPPTFFVAAATKNVGGKWLGFSFLVKPAVISSNVILGGWGLAGCSPE